MKVLLLTAEPVDEPFLRAALGDDLAGAEVLVVSPALNDSPLAFWVSDSDEAIQRAEDVQLETVERLAEDGVDAAGDTGESEPMQALQDALATFPAERVVIASHPEGERAYREDLAADAERRFGVPVVEAQVSR